MTSLYDELGGAAAIDAAVDIFYRKVLGDDHLARFFDDVDMERQIGKQKGFLTMAFGGPNNYTGADMRKGHARVRAMGIDDSHVDAVIGHLGDTLRELGVSEDRIARVAAIADSVRDDVLGRTSRA
jgi:hemoglobin